MLTDEQALPSCVPDPEHEHRQMCLCRSSDERSLATIWARKGIICEYTLAGTADSGERESIWRQREALFCRSIVYGVDVGQHNRGAGPDWQSP